MGTRGEGWGGGGGGGVALLSLRRIKIKSRLAEFGGGVGEGGGREGVLKRTRVRTSADIFWETGVKLDVAPG